MTNNIIPLRPDIREIERRLDEIASDTHAKASTEYVAALAAECRRIARNPRTEGASWLIKTLSYGASTIASTSAGVAGPKG
jgi:hypothetical protein